jgi:hypothetical protein
VANANQANCDGDAKGDVCDNENAKWSTSIQQRLFVVWYEDSSGCDLWTAQRAFQTDVSSCHAPARNYCIDSIKNAVGMSPQDCIRYPFTADCAAPRY